MTAIYNTGSFQSEHEVTLQGLSQWLPYPDSAKVPGGKVFYGVDNFAGSEKQWSEVPIIFVPAGTKVSHPDHTAISLDPEGTAKALGFKIAGRLNNVKVTGSQVTADAVLSDPQAAQLAKDNLLGLSTGFNAEIDNNGRISGSIDPNHVLIFMKCGKATTGHCGTGNDPRAIFNNLEEEFDTTGMSDAQIARVNAVRDAKRAVWEKTQPMILARGKFDPKTGEYRDFLPSEIPEFNGRC